jgi:PAS domain S-box-containing protein
LAVTSKQYQQLKDENKELRARLVQAEMALEAIRNGRVDALVLSGDSPHHIYATEDTGRLYRVMLESMQEGAAALTLDGLILYCNQRLAEMLRCPLENVLGAWFSQFLNPTDWMRIRHLLEEGAVNRSLEAFLQRGGGTSLPVNLNFGIPQVQEMSTIVMVVSDLSERKQFEQVLRDSEALYRTLVESSEASIAVLDKNGVYLFANTELARRLGRSPEDVSGMKMEEFFPPEVARRQLERLRAVLASQQGQVFESISLIHGKPRLYRTSIQPILGASGRPVLALVHAVDVTEVRLAKEEVAASAARYQNLFENTPVALIELKITAIQSLVEGLRLQGVTQVRLYASQQPEFIAQVLHSIQVEDANQAALDLFAAESKPDFINHWRTLVDPEAQEFLMACLEALFEQRKELTFETTMLTLAGGRKNILARLEFEQRDQEYYVLAAYTDITDRKIGETALKKSNRALKMLNECNSALAHAEDEGQLLTEICRLIVESGGYCMAWVGLAENDPQQSVRPVAQYGVDDGYLAQARISWADTERGRGPTGTAIREGKLQINQNFAANPKMAPWREAALKRGYQSSIVLPLKDGQTTIGALTLYSTIPDAFDEEEANLLSQLADDLAFGMIAVRERHERQRAQETARRWEHIFQYARWGVVVGSVDEQRLELMNPEFARMHGYTVEQLTGMPILDVFAPEERAGVHGHIQQAHETGHHVYESVHLRKDGSTFPVVVDITAVKDENGQVRYRVVNVRDITERKCIEIALQQANQTLEERVAERTAELRLSEQRFRLALKNAPVTVAAQDKDLRFIWAYNQRTVDPTAVLGKTDADIFPPETAAVLVPLKRKVLETGQEIREQIWVTSGGRRVFLDLFLEPMRDEAGKISGVGIATVDLTEFKQTEETLQENEKR